MSRTTWLLLALAASVAILSYQKKAVIADAAITAGGAIKDMFTPRGFRNNNPGNIRHGQNWQGMAAQQTDAAFVQFISPEYGIRAISKILDSYSTKYGIHTVRGVINRWAPPNENDTEAYIEAVADSIGVSPDDHINMSTVKSDMIAAIITHENGSQPYDLAQINSGSMMA